MAIVYENPEDKEERLQSQWQMADDIEQLCKWFKRKVDKDDDSWDIFLQQLRRKIEEML